MVPVPSGYFEKINFNELEDIRYQDLFRKEYAFCVKDKGKYSKKSHKKFTKIKRKQG